MSMDSLRKLSAFAARVMRAYHSTEISVASAAGAGTERGARDHWNGQKYSF